MCFCCKKEKIAILLEILTEKPISFTYGLLIYIKNNIMKKNCFMVIVLLLVIAVLWTLFFKKNKEYEYWIEQFATLSPNVDDVYLQSDLEPDTIFSWNIQKIALSYPILDWPASLHFCQSWLYARLSSDDNVNQEFLSGFLTMREKRLGNFDSRENAPEFGSYYSESWESLTGNMFDIINGRNSYFQLQWYDTKDFVYDSKIKEYFCVSPDDYTTKYRYPLDNLYQNPQLPLSFYPYFFSLAEQQEWQKIKDLIVVLQKKWYSPLPFGRRYFDNKDWYLNAVSLENHWILLEYNIAWKKQQYSLYYSDGYFFLITFFQKTTLE